MTYKILLVEPNDSWQIILKGKIKDALKEIGHGDDLIKIMMSFKESFDALQDRENNWDLLITDISLGTPQKLGIQLVELANQIDIPSIAISGSPDVQISDVSSILTEFNSSYFFAKQAFNGKKFKEKIKEILQKTSQSLQNYNLNINSNIISQFEQRKSEKTRIELAQRKAIFEINTDRNVKLSEKKQELDQRDKKAHRLEEQQKFNEAITAYQDIIDSNQYYLKAWEGLERIYRNLGDSEKHISTLEQVQLIRGIIDFEKNAAQKITVKQLQLTNLDFFGNSSWTFQPQINILLGKNGYGKSHLLRLIISLLQKDDNISSEFFADKLTNASMKLTLERNKAEQVIHRSKTVFEESIGKVPVLAIPDLRYIDKSKNTISLIDNEKGDLREAGAYHFLYQKSFEALIQNFLYELCIMFIDRGRSFDLPIFKLLHKVVQELTDEAFKFHEIKPRGNARFEIDVITDGNNDRPLPLQKASQGTLAVLSIFGLIYYYLKSVFSDTPEEDLLNKHALVFIDEVDAHLHPSWQQKIIRLLRDNFPKVQFVVTAHSPLVVAGCLHGEVAVLRQGEDGFVIEEFRDEDFIGTTTENLYRKLFEIEDIDENYLYYAKRLSSNLDNSERINALESKETLTDEEAKELEELHRDDYYISRLTKKREDKKAEKYAIAKLKAKVMELEAQVNLLKNQKIKRDDTG